MLSRSVSRKKWNGFKKNQNQSIIVSLSYCQVQVQVKTWANTKFGISIKDDIQDDTKWLQTITVCLLTISLWSHHSKWHSGWHLRHFRSRSDPDQAWFSLIFRAWLWSRATWIILFWGRQSHFRTHFNTLETALSLNSTFSFLFDLGVDCAVIGFGI